MYTYHPSEPEAGFTCCAEGDIGRRDVRWCLQGLDFPRGLAWRTGAHYVYLTHSEPKIQFNEQWVNRRSWCLQEVQIEVCVPVEGVWVETFYDEGSCVRLISQLMDHDPLFIFPDYTNLCDREWNKIHIYFALSWYTDTIFITGTFTLSIC